VIDRLRRVRDGKTFEIPVGAMPNIYSDHGDGSRARGLNRVARWREQYRRATS
jgi:hypothetical protein